MIVTFQIQVDEPDKKYTRDQLNDMTGLMNEFCAKLEKYGYVRCGIYADNEVFNGDF